VRVLSVFSLILPAGGETKYLRLGCSRQLHSLNLALMPFGRGDFRCRPSTFYRTPKIGGDSKGLNTLQYMLSRLLDGSLGLRNCVIHKDLERFKFERIRIARLHEDRGLARVTLPRTLQLVLKRSAGW